MRAAGVRLPDGRAIWVDAGKHSMSPLDEAVVRLPEADVAGLIFVTPEQFIEPPEHVTATVVEVRARELTEEPCGDLPGSHLPYLGSTVRAEGVEGRVTAIDPVNQTVAVTHKDGTVLTVSAAEVEEPK